MGLNEKERAALEALQKKAKEPDPMPVGRSITASIDLSDEKQVERAIKYGFLPADDSDPGGDGDGDGGGDGDDPPKRRGYFNDED